MTLGIDFAFRPHPSPSQIKAAGFHFVCRYLSPVIEKNISRAEASELHASGLDIVAVWESGGGRALAGKTAGHQDANAAKVQATHAGMPDGRPIYFAVDFDESPTQAAAVANYFAGVREVLGLKATGAYGSYYAIKRLFDAGLITYGWQTYAWSGGQLDHRAQLYQYSNGHTLAGAGVDYDRALSDDFGQWHFKQPATDPAGHLKFAGTFDASSGQWGIEGVSSDDAQFGSAERWASAEIQVCVGGKRRGQWRITHLPWNAKPLGG